MTLETKKNKFDVVVLGGGLVGLTMALLCAQNKLSVALVEAQEPVFTWGKDGFDLRVSAITRASQQIFQKLDVWSAMCNERVSPYHRMEVWDGAGFAEITFDAAEVAEPDLGHIIENRVMLKALWEKAKQNDFIQFFEGARSAVLVHENDAVVLGLHSNSKTLQTLCASLIVGADGARSWLRETLQIETRGWDYEQSALVATVTTEEPHQKTAWQRFLPEGPLAFLPLSKPNISSIVWSTNPVSLENYLHLSDSEFCEELAHAFDYRLGKILIVDERQSFSLKMLYAKRSIADRVALIGDAAHVIHPLAGQGVNLGLLDAECLSEVLREARGKCQDIGQSIVLRRYERRRKGHTMMMIGMMEFFKRLFSTDKTAAVALRGIGVNLVTQTSWLKKKFIREAMGI